MQFSITAEDMHAAAAEMNEIYDAQREEAWDAQDNDGCWGGDDVSECEHDEPDAEDDGEPRCNDLSDDAEALASAGFGTDEDYGCYGGEDSFLDGYYESQTECDFGEWPTGAAKAASFFMFFA